MSLPAQRLVVPVLLQALAELGGRARPSDVYPLVTRAFPDIQPEDLTTVLQDGRTNRWLNLIQWSRQRLVLLQLIDASERGVWKLTPKGESAAAEHVSVEDLARAWAAYQAERARSKRPDPAQAAVAHLAEAPELAAGEGENDTGARPATVAVLQSRPELLVGALQAASNDSKDPNRLERAVAEAFGFLGFGVEWLGGAGRTDVLLRAPLGIRRYSVVVDAKSTARDRVTDGQVDWLSIRTHREQERAQYACLIGIDFAGGQLLTRAAEFEVALLTVGDLGEIITLHGETPLTLGEIRPIFLSTPATKAALPQIRAAARERRRRRLLIVRLLTHIDNFNQAQPDIVLAKPETLLASILGERNPDLLGTTLEDVRRTLSLLETIGAISAVNGEGYVSETSVEGTLQLLAAFGTPSGADATADGDASSIVRVTIP
jgi:hypothetical protein